MHMASPQPYRAASFPLSGLKGISDKTLEMHFKLYEGYVTQTNLLNDQIQEILRDGKIDQEEAPAYSEITRRLAFEYNGMVLHEFYFGNMRKNGEAEPPSSSKFRAAASDRFGSWERWKADFVGVGKMRGVGWAACFLDPTTNRLSNQWITLHEVGGVVGFQPLLVMDVWEHAFLLDYKPAERTKYIDAFFENIDWAVVDHRLQAGGPKSRID
jgi:Fe-Mn family superoxide dismutase